MGLSHSKRGSSCLSISGIADPGLILWPAVSWALVGFGSLKKKAVLVMMGRMGRRRLVTPMEQGRSSSLHSRRLARGAAVPCGHRLRHDQNACDGGELLVVVVVLSRHFLGGGSQDALE